MIFHTAQIESYKSFYEPTRLPLSPGFNIITGRNNSGKTALLEALSLRCIPAGHRSKETVPAGDFERVRPTKVIASCTISAEELFRLVPPQTPINLVPPRPRTAFAQQIEYDGLNDNSLRAFATWFIAQPTFEFTLGFSVVSGQGTIVPVPSVIPSFGMYEPDNSPNQAPQILSIYLDGNRNIRQITRQQNGTGMEIGPSMMGEHLRNRVYLFRAERFNIGRSHYGANQVLAPDAANLPEVLNFLQHNIGQFREYNDAVHSILPDVQAVSVRPVAGETAFEIVVWNIAPNLKRADLAVPLAASGTGVAQVLAILYVALTATEPKTILIDEPQSFLHPGAARKLMDILAASAQHQYVIATHSPAIISSCEPNTITIVRNTGGVSTLHMVDSGTSANLRECISELGASLSDVFGADAVLWVEGQTEEICFPKILLRLAGRRLMGTVIRGVRNTGDFDAKDAEAAIDLYTRVSGAGNLLPPAIAFIFDAECRTEQKKNEIKHRALGVGVKAVFIPRRMYENYLLHPGAIAAVLSADDSGMTEYSPARVGTVLEEKLKDGKYFKGVGAKRPLADPLALVNGAKVLADLFSELSEARVSFHKTKHCVRITDWLIENDPEALRDVSDFLLQVLYG